jgi:hypothetical protein
VVETRTEDVLVVQEVMFKSTNALFSLQAEHFWKPVGRFTGSITSCEIKANMVPWRDDSQEGVLHGMHVTQEGMFVIVARHNLLGVYCIRLPAGGDSATRPTPILDKTHVNLTPPWHAFSLGTGSAPELYFKSSQGPH